MGRVKTGDIKRLAKKLIRENPSLFSTDFQKNKEALKQLGIEHKRYRNKLAGYITRLMKRSATD